MNRILVTGANGQLGNEMRRLAGGKNGKDCYIFTDIAELDITDLALCGGRENQRSGELCCLYECRQGRGR